MSGFGSLFASQLFLLQTTLNFCGFGGMTSILTAFTELEEVLGELSDLL